MMEIHEKIKYLLWARELRQVDVANAMNVKQQAVQQWCKSREEGGTKPKAVHKLAEVFKVNLSLLLSDNLSKDEWVNRVGGAIQSVPPNKEPITYQPDITETVHTQTKSERLMYKLFCQAYKINDPMIIAAIHQISLHHKSPNKKENIRQAIECLTLALEDEYDQDLIEAPELNNS